MIERLREGNVAVLLGGWSAEREVSLRSGEAVLGALKRRGYRARGVDAGRDLAAVLTAERPSAVFIALHGTGGEDGAVQGLLETMGIPYTGSGILASALAMSKTHSKWLFERHGIPTPPWALIRRNSGLPAADPVFDLPVVVKPPAEGSTVGISLVREAAEYEPALERAFGAGDEALVEEFIPGRELTVAILGRFPLPAIEIVAPNGFYDYDAKYLPGATSYVVPAVIEPELAGRLADFSLRAAELLDTRGAVRCDWRVTPAGDPFILEVNTIPGMTETSLLPKAAAAAGIGFDELVERILLSAVEEEG